MIELKGAYNTAKVFTDYVEQTAVAQIIHLLNQPFVAGSKIRIMPDVHAGMGCTIGTTMTVTDKTVPNLVGVDIGCGMETLILNDSHVELQKLDKAIHQNIPCGFAVRQKTHSMMDELDLTALRCAKAVQLARAEQSLGTLGGGNHFIELGRDPDGKLYLVIHSGSRHLGKQVADFYQKAAAGDLERQAALLKDVIVSRKGKEQDPQLQTAQKKLKMAQVECSLAFAEGPIFEDYLHDMAIIQQYADLNRRAMAKELIRAMKFKVKERFATVHNYIDLQSMILRKGAISARCGERVLIPMNMRDGSLICIGRGNEDWNQSAPHGAGRLMSRAAAKASITLTAFRDSMAGIYSTTVNKNTLDESPFAYKPMDEIVEKIHETVDVVTTIRPLYNFKAAE